MIPHRRTPGIILATEEMTIQMIFMREVMVEVLVVVMVLLMAIRVVILVEVMVDRRTTILILNQTTTTKITPTTLILQSLSTN